MTQWRVEFEDKARKAITRLSSADQGRLRNFINGRVLSLPDPRMLGTALTGEFAGLWRYRVDDIRIIARIKHDILLILVVDVGNRGDIYR